MFPVKCYTASCYQGNSKCLLWVFDDFVIRAAEEIKSFMSCATIRVVFLHAVKMVYF